MYKQIDLPSKCLVYPNISPQDIKIRPLKGRDEKFIASLSYENLEQKFADLLKEVLQGIDPLELTTGDRLFLLIWLIINSYDPKVNMEGFCVSCFQKISLQVDLSELEVIELPDNFKEPYSITLDNGDVINLRLFRLKDEIKVENYEKKNLNSWLYRYSLSLVDDKSIDDRVKYLEELSVKDLAKIRAFHEKYYHGPKMETSYVCPKCNVEEVMPCPFRLEWLLPFGKTLIRTFGNGI